MKFTTRKKNQIKFYILEKIFENDKDLKKHVANTHNISITTVYRYLKELEDEGVIFRNGKDYTLTRNTKYFVYDMTKVSDENAVFRRDILPNLVDLPRNLKVIWEYAFTEMFNNVIDHSESKECMVFVTENKLYTWMEIRDDGVGIFNKIKNYFNQDTIEQVIIDLFKGKLTTDPSRHSGEGIFFTSKIMDKFYAISGNQVFSHSNLSEHNEYIDEKHTLKDFHNSVGTLVLLVLCNNSEKDLTDVFNTYSTPDEGLTRTVLPMRFACDSGYPISRSQAKRLTVGIDRYKEIELDFTDVENIGQGFSDELFRVFANKHPEIKLMPVNANDNVLKMISHVKNDKY